MKATVAEVFEAYIRADRKLRADENECTTSAVSQLASVLLGCDTLLPELNERQASAFQEYEHLVFEKS